MVDHTIDSLTIDIESDSQSAIQSINKLASSLRKIKTELGKGFNTDNLKSSIRSIAELAPTTKVATKEIGSLVSSFKNLKQEMSSGFNAKEFKDIAKALSEISSKSQKAGANIGKNLSKSVEKAAPGTTQKMRELISSLGKDVKIPVTLSGIDKQIASTERKLKELNNKKQYAIISNNGETPRTESYKKLSLDVIRYKNELKELQKAREKLTSQKDSIANTVDIPTKGIQSASDSLKTVATDYKQIKEEAEKAKKAAAEFNNSVQTDDPSPRLQKFIDDAVNGTTKRKEIWDKARENVGENFSALPESIEDTEKLISSLENKLGSFKEKLQTGLDTSKIKVGDKRWNSLNYEIASLTTKIEIAKKSLNDLLEFQSQDAEKKLKELAEQVKLGEEETKQWKESLSSLGKDFKAPDNFKDLEKVISSLSKKYDDISEKFQRAINVDKIEEGSQKWRGYEYDLTLVGNKLDIAKEKLRELVALSKEVEAPQVSTPEVPTGNQGNDITGKALTATVSFSTLSKTIGNFSKTLDGLSGKMSNVLTGLYAPLRHVVAEYKAKLGDIGNIFKKLGNTVSSATKTIKTKWDNLVHSFSKMVMRRALYAVLQTINDAMGSLANFAGTTGQKFNEAMSNMTSSARYAGANIVAAFSPLVNSIAPMIDALVEKLVGAITVINQFFAALTGNNVYVKAKKVVTDYAESVNKANKAQKDLVLGIDELNINNPDKNDSASGAAGEAYEWEEAPVLNKIKDFADKVKDILSKLFDPLKQAWDNAGDYVISGFKYMAGEISKLAASIGSDFLTMWQEEATVRIFENILGIIGDIEYTIGNLAHNFREAWEENNIGLHIFENLRDILAIIVEHVRNVTKYMKEWSKTINFKPLLDSFNGLLESLKPVADFIGGVFEDVMERVVLRHIKWLTEEGIPHLNDTLASIADAFDWGKLRSDIQPVEDAFANLAEAIHTGVVNALGNLGEALAGITNTETFTTFMQNIANIINLIDADLVEKVLTALGNGILKVVDAVVKFVGSEAFTNFLSKFKDWLKGLTAEDIEHILGALAGGIIAFKFTAFLGKGATACLNFLTTLSAITGLGTTAGGISAVGSAINFLGTALLAVTVAGVSEYGIVTTIQDLNSAIKDGNTAAIISNVTLAIIDLINPIAALNDGIATLVTGALEKLGLFDKDSKESSGNVKKHFSDMWNSIHKSSDYGTAGVEQYASQMTKSLNDSSSDSKEKVSSNYSSLVSSLKETFDKSGKDIKKSFEDTNKNIKDSSSDTEKNTKTTWTNIGTNLTKEFNSINADATRSFGTLQKTATDNAHGTNDNVTKSMENLYKNVSGSFSSIEKDADSSFSSMNKTISDKTKDSEGVFDKFVDKLKKAFDFEWELPKLKLPHFKIDGEFSLNPPSVPHINIDWYASGGILGKLNSYSLFGAGENGIPEILGTVGGKSAVAGGEEITGIRDQVYESGVAEQALLNQAISLLQVIADKNYNVELDGRSLVSGINNRSARNGYSMATVT